MKIPLVDLKAQYLSIKSEIDLAVRKVIDATDFIMGEEVKEFEYNFAQFLGVKHAIGVSSGTDAIHLALLALGIKNGDEIIVPSHTFIATAEPIVWIGAKPIFVDIDPKTYLMDPKKIEDAISPRTKAIIPVHVYGQAADLAQIMQIGKKRNIKVIEDAAQAHGATLEYEGSQRNVGTIGDIGIFSFYPGKNLGAYGDAGALVTSSDELAAKIRLLRNHGRKEKYTHEIVGYGDRIDTLQASILSAKLKYLQDWNTKRQEKAGRYSKELKDIPGIVIPYIFPKSKSVFHLYVIQVENRDKLQAYLKEKGIETGVHYPLPLHMQPAFSHLGYKVGALPVTEKLADRILSLPLYPELTNENVSIICGHIRDFYITKSAK